CFFGWVGTDALISPRSDSLLLLIQEKLIRPLLIRNTFPNCRLIQKFSNNYCAASVVSATSSSTGTFSNNVHDAAPVSTVQLLAAPSFGDVFLSSYTASFLPVSDSTFPLARLFSSFFLT
ncbi:MAG: hypothetical protein IKI93_06960, partial [Clostridia bacterium]|nr:hypothetical protein [Clostridia bacterium]